MYVEHLDSFLALVVGPLSDVTDGASLTARRQSVHHAASTLLDAERARIGCARRGHSLTHTCPHVTVGGGGPKRRFTMISGMSIGAKKRRDREVEAMLRSGEVAVLWSRCEVS